ncbi:3-deoxy-7-phosphoheptulonate synthase [Oceanospirillum sp. MED92]|uniref:3-deoxy-7-phosphoheptulonate synthase n=1 Tax=Neptuniibacter caesariensis TaxID=207954 RepID=A0A7U8GTE3_NEPCE|nr:3-deoxy-7-phosphoheptulonate synthase [Oceanospirillum sp. MED92] [Neptuniibacter caesariensis]
MFKSSTRVSVIITYPAIAHLIFDKTKMSKLFVNVMPVLPQTHDGYKYADGLFCAKS